MPALESLVPEQAEVRIRPVLAGPAVLERGVLEVRASEACLQVRAPPKFLRSILQWCDGIKDMQAIAELAHDAWGESGFPAFAKSMLNAGVLVHSASNLPPALRPPSRLRDPAPPPSARCALAHADTETETDTDRDTDTGTDADRLSALATALELQQLQTEWAARGEPALHVRMLVVADSDAMQAGTCDVICSDEGRTELRRSGPLDTRVYRTLADPLLLENSAALLVISTRSDPRAPSGHAPAWRTAFLNLGVLVDRARRWSQSHQLEWRDDIACSEALLRHCPGSAGEVLLYAAAVGFRRVRSEAASDVQQVSWADTPAHHGLYIAKATTTPADSVTGERVLAWGRSYDAQMAVHKAMGELAERVALQTVPTTRQAKAHDLANHVRPEVFARYTPGQLRRLGLDAFDPSNVNRWAEATEWVTGRTVWIPADCVYLHKRGVARSPQRPLMKLTSSGCASDVRLQSAIHRAAYELVERDALARHWLAQSPARRIAPDSLTPQIQSRIRILEQVGCNTVVLCMTAGQCGPSILVLVQNAARGFTCAGSACGESAPDAVERAFIEAEFAALTRCAGTASASISSRAVASPKEHSQLHAQRRHFRRADVLVGPAQDEMTLPEIAWPASLQARLESAAGALSLYWVELGKEKPNGEHTQRIRTVRALIPGCIPLGFGYDALPRGMVSHPVSLAARFPHPLG